MFIPDPNISIPDPDFSIPDPGVKKALDPGSGSATLHVKKQVFCNQNFVVCFFIGSGLLLYV
jgi:hypothetical protein